MPLLVSKRRSERKRTNKLIVKLAVGGLCEGRLHTNSGCEKVKSFGDAVVGIEAWARV